MTAVPVQPSATTELTPTEELLMAALTARIRLGEPWWTFDTRHRRTLTSLEAKGLIWVEAASVEALEAHLTDRGREEWLSETYTPQGADIEWGVKTTDDLRPVHYVLRSVDQSGSECYHRKYAARHAGALYRRWSVTSEWVEVPVEVKS